MRVAAIDMGSNSFLCLIAEKGLDGQLIELYDGIEFVKLGAGIQKTKKISQDSLQRAEQALQKFQGKCRDLGVDVVSGVATSASRDAENKEDFFDLCKKYEVPVEIISGNSEAEYTYQGVLSGRPQKPDFTVLDIGGGSTEFASVQNGQLLSQSFDIGCVRLTEMFLPTIPEQDADIQRLRNYLEEQFSKKLPCYGQELVGVAGTPTTLASLYLEKDFNPNLVEGFALSRSMIDSVIKKLRNKTLEERRELRGIDAPRADVIMAGAQILKWILETLELEQIIVSTRGVRYGLANKLLGE